MILFMPFLITCFFTNFPMITPHTPCHGLYPLTNSTLNNALTDAATRVNVLSHGAKGDGITNDTTAFMAAWNETCQSQSPAIMYVPPGLTFLVYPIVFSGPCNANVTVQVGGKIIAPSNPLEWSNHEQKFWMGFEYLNNFLFTGGGIIDGQGHDWWPCVRYRYDECPSMSPPTLLRIHESNNVKVDHLTFISSPNTHINFHKCNGVAATHLEIASPSNSPNTDGIHVHRSRNTLISNCNIASGDDCISIGTGSIGLKIQDIFCGPGHGISIGSLGRDHTEANVSDIYVDHAAINDTRYGVRIKTWQGGSGFATNITFQNIMMYRVRYPISINQYYCTEALGPCTNETSTVKISHVRYKNIKGTSTTRQAIRFACSDTIPCTDIFMDNIDLTYDANGESISFCQGIKGTTAGNVIPPTCFD